MNEDLKKYEEIVKRCENLDDLPPRRIKRLEKAVPEKVEIRKPQVTRPGKQRAAKKQPKVHKNNTLDTKKPALKKPSFIHKALTPKDKKIPPETLRKKAHSFENQFMVNNSYEKMIAILKDSDKDTVDFGMLWKLLPKNLEYENKRFTFEQNDSELLSVMRSQKGLPFSEDIDRFLQQLDDSMASNGPPVI